MSADRRILVVGFECEELDVLRHRPEFGDEHASANGSLRLLVTAIQWVGSLHAHTVPAPQDKLLGAPAFRNQVWDRFLRPSLLL